MAWEASQRLSETSLMVWNKLANCAILGVIGALKLALASKLPRQGVNWRVDYFPLIFPLFAFLFHFFLLLV